MAPRSTFPRRSARTQRGAAVSMWQLSRTDNESHYLLQGASLKMCQLHAANTKAGSMTGRWMLRAASRPQLRSL